MKIGIYALGLDSGTAGGLEIYFRNLIKGLWEYNNKNEYYIFVGNKEIKKAVQPYTNSHIKLIYHSKIFRIISFILIMLFAKPKIFFKILVNEISRLLSYSNIYDVDIREVYSETCRMKLNFQKYGIDAVHFPFTTIHPHYLNISLPIILTVADIQQEYYPEFFDNETIKMRSVSYRPSAERADVIIAISEYTKKTLIEKYNIKAKKIVVAYPGCSKDFKKIDDTALLNSVRSKYDLLSEFMLYPASTWPHKNHIKLLEAISILRSKYSFEKPVVLTGASQNNHKNIMDTIERLDLKGLIKFLSFVPFSDLPVIYNLATIMVFPSFFEGFGIPLVEAINVGLPIACSDRTSIPEVVGDAGIYFNPDSAEDIAEKIYQLWKDEDLRRRLIKKGLERAKRFAWKQGIEMTSNAYKQAFQRRIQQKP